MSMSQLGQAPARYRLPPELQTAVDETLGRAIDERWASRIWSRDVTVWTDDRRVGELIADRLGWLDAPSEFGDRAEELAAFADAVRAEGFEAAVVCGMGGSSLAPEVIARSLATTKLAVAVLDSTDPAAVRATHERNDPDRTLYLIASKSGTTTETLSFLTYFWQIEDERHAAIPEAAPGQHFVAISDPGDSVRAIPHHDLFRELFLNPADVGGRYSALTYVGLVPAALQGVDLQALLVSAIAMARRCEPDAADNPGLSLGVALGALATIGRDKLTLVTNPEIAGLGAWIEQLIAESTGKHGVGIVPVDNEPLAGPDRYADDRVFVRIGAAGEGAWAAQTDRALEELGAAGHPVIDLASEGEGLGGEFFRWEFATAVAGAVLRINPFDEPNVTESKDNTRRVLREFDERGELPRETPLATGGLSLYGDSAMRLTHAGATIDAELRRHLARARPSAYVAIQAYIAPSEERDGALREIRTLLRDRTRYATTVGYGPRFLHSTGQLHKGGPRTGCFMQITADHPEDVEIPGHKETFGTLIDAQALGDFASLEAHELPVVRVHLGAEVDAGLAELRRQLEAAL